MSTVELPIFDLTHLSDSTIEAVRKHHNADDLLEFRGMSEKEIDGYIGTWLSTLPAFALIEFYEDAQDKNGFVQDTILELYTSEKSKSETERTMLRNAFQRPGHNVRDPKPWAQKIEECVNAVIKKELEERAEEATWIH